jgi:hypothetical protein
VKLGSARLYRLRKNTRFVSGHRFSGAVSSALMNAPLGAEGSSFDFFRSRLSRADKSLLFLSERALAGDNLLFRFSNLLGAK